MLPMVSQSNQLTMSSREIAELLNCRYDSVKRTMERLRDKGLIQLTPMVEVNGRGQTVGSYHVNEENSYIVVAQLSPEFTAAIVKRWRELESGLKPRLPQTFAEALQLAADQARQIELQAPKVAFVENLVERDNLMTATQVAQKHGKSAIWLNKILSEHDVYNKNVRRGRAFRQRFIDNGYGKMKQSESGHDQALFTNAGEVWINELLLAHGYA